MQRPHKRDAYRSLLKPAAVPVMSTIWMTSKTEREQERKRERARARERERARNIESERERGRERVNQELLHNREKRESGFTFGCVPGVTGFRRTMNGFQTTARTPGGHVEVCATWIRKRWSGA